MQTENLILIVLQKPCYLADYRHDAKSVGLDGTVTIT